MYYIRKEIIMENNNLEIAFIGTIDFNDSINEQEAGRFNTKSIG